LNYVECTYACYNDHMSTHIPWQSWSPIKPSIFRMPRWDYSPVALQNHQDQISHARERKKITGWCSWYAFGKQIDHHLIIAQAIKIKELGLPIEYILIDDGWAQWGDWNEPDRTRFPKGIHGLVKELKQLGFSVGLWIAPFLCEPYSEFARHHPEWIVKSSNNSFFPGLQSFPGEKFFPWKKYLLDCKNDVVIQHIYQRIDEILNWGIDLLKLDFLYAPYFDPSILDDEIPYNTLQSLFLHIRSRHPNTYVIACGCPEVPARYVVDAWRVSKDIVIPQLYNIPLLSTYIHDKRVKLLEEKIQAFEKHSEYFALDPDVCVVSKRTGLSLNNIAKLIKIVKKNKDVCFLGDNLKSLTREEIKKAASIFE